MDTDLEDPDTDKRNPNGITRCQSMMVNEDQYQGNWTKIRETSIVPGDSSCSQWVEQSAREVVVPHGSEGRAQDLETSPRRVCRTRKRLSERGEERSIAD